MLRGLPLRGWPRGIELLVIVVLGLLAPGLATRLGATWVAGIALGTTAALYAGAAHLGFVALGWILPVALPLALALGLLAALALQAMAASVERRRTRDLFSRFVGDEVVDAVLAHADGARLGGERLCSTVVFCDLRGFTAFAEGISAERVIEVLNRYLGEMSEAILDHGGTLVSYQGDGIMSVFGAPIEHADHADRALDAAREMLVERLPRFNAWVRAEGLSREDFKMGIGINSSTVMSGHVGSERRLEYTALGDTTNTAARLQGYTKEYGTAVLVSDTTRAMLRRDAPDLRYLDAITVRGKRAKVNPVDAGAHDSPECRVCPGRSRRSGCAGRRP